MSVIARITNQGSLKLVDEIIEYPKELEGGRNCFIDKLMLDVTNYEEIGSYYYYTIENLSPNEAYTFSVKGNFANEITIPTIGNRALRVNNDKTNSLGVDIIDVRADFGVRTYKRQVNSNEDGKLFIVSFVPDLLPEIYRMVKLEKGNKDTEWTPAPEDLGLKYPDDIQHFSTGFRADGKVMVRELIGGANMSFDIDRKLYLEKLEEGVDLDGTT